jgi:tRNA(adenine34) deaminase
LFDLCPKALYKCTLMIKDDTYYMTLAIREAKQAREAGEVPVGAVIVDRDLQVIGQGHNAPISLNDPTCHAEIAAIRRAAMAQNNYRLPGTTLYVTIEPCIMCMGAIIHARIDRVVFGAKDPGWGAACSLYRMAEDPRLNHHPKVVSGICEEETRNLITGFFKDKRSR